MTSRKGIRRSCSVTAATSATPYVPPCITVARWSQAGWFVAAAEDDAEAAGGVSPFCQTDGEVEDSEGEEESILSKFSERESSLPK